MARSSRGREPGGQRFDQREAAAFAMAAEHEQVRRAHQRFHVRVWHAPQELHAIAQCRVASDARLDGGLQRGRAEAHPQPQSRERADGKSHALEHGKWILVGIEMPHP